MTLTQYLRFVPASVLDPAQFAVQAKMTVPLATAPLVGDVLAFVLDRSHLAASENPAGTDWLLGFGSKIPIREGSFSFAINLIARKIGSGEDYYHHQGNHQHIYQYELYEILQGSIHYRRSEQFRWPGAWSGNNDRLNEVVYGTSSFHLAFRRNGEMFNVGWLPDRRTLSSASARFWEMLSCGNSNPADYVRHRLDVLKDRTPAHIALFPQTESLPRVLFRDDRSNTDPRQILVPDRGIEFPRSVRRPQWMPGSVEVTADEKFLFRNYGPFDLPREEENAVREIVIRWTGDQKAVVDRLGSLTLVDSSLPAANGNGALWQYGYLEEVSQESRPAWIAYPLPGTSPTLRVTDPLGMGMTSPLTVPVEIEQAEWALSLAPLAVNQKDEPGAAIEMEFIPDRLQATLKVREERFDVRFESPGLFLYGERLVDARMAPSPTSLGQRLKQARLRFSNAPVAGSVMVTVNDSAATFRIVHGESARVFQFSGEPLLRYVSPAGANLLEIPEAGGKTTTLPDTTRGLVERKLEGSFGMTFPGFGSSSDELILGKITVQQIQADSGKAIHALFPWVELEWSEGSTVTVSRRHLYHRNLVLEPIEFFRRIREQQRRGQLDPSVWTDRHVFEFVRDHFSRAARDVGGSPKAIDNFLKNADVTPQPMVSFDDSGKWPLAKVVLDQHVQKLHVKVDHANPKWLAYQARVDRFDDVPKIFLAPAEDDHHPPSPFQPLIGDCFGDKVFDNVGVTRSYCGVETGRDLRLQPVSIGGNQFFVLDCQAQFQNGGDVRLVCHGLVLREATRSAETRVLKPVESAVPELGDRGCFRIYSQPAAGRFGWPMLGGYPVVPFALKSVTLVEERGQLSVNGIEFTGALPSPRDVAFPDKSEFSTAVRRSNRLARMTVTCNRRAVSAEGDVNWQFDLEATGLVVAGPVGLRGTGKFESGNWLLNDVKADVAVFDQAIGNVDILDLKSHVSGEVVRFRTAGQGQTLGLSTHPPDKPTFHLEAELSGDGLNAVLTCQNEETGECGVILKLGDDAWSLEAIHDRVYGFLLNDNSAALTLWHEGGFRYRQWTRQSQEGQNVTLSAPGSSVLIALHGVVSEFLVFEQAVLARRFLSASLNSVGARPGDPRLQLVIVSQECDASQPDAAISAQITMRYPDSEQGAETLVGGTVLLHPQFQAGGLTHLTLSEGVYDLLPARRIDRDRTGTDVLIPGEEPQALDLVPLASIRSPGASPAFFVWHYGLVSSLREVKSVSLPLNPAGCVASVLEAEEASTDAEKTPADEGIVPVGAASDDDFPSEKDDDASPVETGPLLTAVSAEGKFFVARAESTTGHLLTPDGNSRCVLLGAPILSVAFQGEHVLLATASRIFRFTGNTLRNVTTEYPSLSDITGIRVDPRNSNRRWVFDENGRWATIVPRSGNSPFRIGPRQQTLLAAGQLRVGADTFLIGFYRRSSAAPTDLYFIPDIPVKELNDAAIEADVFASTTWDSPPKCFFVCSRQGSLRLCSLDRATREINATVLLELQRSSAVVSLSLVRFDNLFGIGVAYGLARPAELLLARRKTSDSGEYEVIQTIELPPAQRIDLVAGAKDITVFLTQIQSEQFQVGIVRFPGGLAGRMADVPIDRCTDAELTRPPVDQSLTAPQEWHLRSDGMQLMSGMASWKPISSSQTHPENPYQPVKTDWLVGPLMETGDRLQVVRTDLAVKASEEQPDPLDSIETNTLFALGREPDVGVLYNQTTTPDELNDIEAVLREVLNRRQWRGLSLWCKFGQDGVSHFQFLLNFESNSLSVRPPVLTGGQDQAGNCPDPRIFPADQLQAGKLDSNASQIYRPTPELIPRRAGTVSDFRQWSFSRCSGRLRDEGDVAEVLMSQVAAFAAPPRRHGIPPRPAMAGDFRVFLPQNLQWKHGPGKPGAMISHRVQPVIYPAAADSVPGRVAPATLAALRDPQRLADDDSPRISEFTTSAAKIAEIPLETHHRVTAKWSLEIRRLAVDDRRTAAQKLTQPQEGEFFIIKDGESYDFAGGNRRLFAVVSVVDSRLREFPQFFEDGGIVRRDPNGDRSLPVQLDSEGGKTPRVYLVSRADLSRELEASDDSSFSVKVKLMTEDGTEWVVGFNGLFEKLTPIGDYHLFVAKESSTGESIWQSGMTLLPFLELIAQGRNAPPPCCVRGQCPLRRGILRTPA